MIKTQGGLIAFNNFLSTSLDHAVSLAFAESNASDPDLMAVLFEINIDPSVSSSLFADIENVSYYRTEEEILFTMHSVFRIKEVKQIQTNDRLWKVPLTLTDGNDSELQNLTKRMHAETQGSTGWFRLGKVMRKVAQFDKAQQVFEITLDQTTDTREEEEIHSELAWIKYDQGEYTEALAYCKQELENKQKTLPVNHPDLAIAYTNIGGMYVDMGEYSKALSSCEKALEIGQRILRVDHPDVATSYNNIGSVYLSMGGYSEALSSYQKALEIRQDTLPANHPDLATCYKNIGTVYQHMGIQV